MKKADKAKNATMTGEQVIRMCSLLSEGNDRQARKGARHLKPFVRCSRQGSIIKLVQIILQLIVPHHERLLPVLSSVIFATMPMTQPRRYFSRRDKTVSRIDGRAQRKSFPHTCRNMPARWGWRDTSTSKAGPLRDSGEEDEEEDLGFEREERVCKDFLGRRAEGGEQVAPRHPDALSLFGSSIRSIK